MSRLIPNDNTWLGFSLVCLDIAHPKVSEINGSVALTKWLMSLNATSTGQTVPTPSLDSLFETSISGTVSATFSADFYRDDENDLAWTTLPRKTKGFAFLSRFGGSGANNKPIAADVIEVWPIMVVSRASSNNANNTVLSFTMTASVPSEPNEAAVVAA